MGRRTLLAGTIAIAAAPPAARAQTAAGYPARPIRVIVPFAPGGASDVAARILQQPMAEALGQPVVVENRAGAAGNIGMEAAARAAPDGYTLYLGNVGTLAVNPAVFARTIRVRPQQDFAPISLVADTPDALVVHPSLPVRTVREFVEYARARPGQLNYGSPGSGSFNRLEMEKLREAAELDMVHVPYAGGAGPAAVAIAAGDIHCLFTTLSSIIGQVQAGRVRALAVTGTRRVAALPEVPTMVESGFPDFDSGSWQGLLAPAGTPPEIVRRLHAVIVEVVAKPEVRQRFAASGTEAVASRSPAEFADLIRREEEKWGALVRRVGAVAE
ncbi:tripartite tricarboxylate transporter substrate binding protein [Caldovatus sp. SYSU G05006]|uniref:Tripartite tricarboxylate transporter substrate binding protein n=1 Tax=Caldovatus aquaticus TaxID=2865671 RepID=A0ABS7EZL1_9PROT|nr:tripartite tricarboxylate transporter substrate binding protein [Caldovatus aquaticus]